MRERGFSVPRVYAAEQADLTLERLAGPTMLRAIADGELDPTTGGEMLADLHTRLHRLPARFSADSADRILHLDLHRADPNLTVNEVAQLDAAAALVSRSRMPG